MVSPDLDEMMEKALESWQPDVEDQLPEREQIEERYANSCEAAKKIARYIDPETAEVSWTFGDVDYPYAGFRLFHYYGYSRRELGSDCLYFARAPAFSPYGEYARELMDSEGWVWFGDLPEAVRDALWEKHKDKLLNSDR
jgi:hypothetical protein